MLCKVLINDTIKRFLLQARPAVRQRLRKSFEYLENGLWDGGLRIKQLRGLSRKTVLEGRITRGERLLLTLGRDRDEDGESLLLVYVWGVVPHDQVESRARAIIPENAPFLSFAEYQSEDVSEVELEKLDDGCFTQEPVEMRVAQDTGAQRWFVLDDQEWRRLLLYSEGEFDIFLYLTPEQRDLLKRHAPLLLSGTAGSGKTTLSIYYLLRPFYVGRPRLLLTYNRHLRNFCERLYRSLVLLTERSDSHPPDFLTFRDLCLRLVRNSEARFPLDREVDLPVFREMLTRLRSADRFDPALVWEEIRSIIKGAKPQLDARVLRKLAESVEAGMEGPALVRDLREEVLSIRNLSLFEKADSAARRVTGSGLSDIGADLPKHLEKRRYLLSRVLRALIYIIEKHEANFATPLLTFAEYERLGRKRAPVFLHDRREIHSIAEWYQGRLQAERLWDEIDLTRAAIRAMDTGAAARPEYDLVCCDEVQDLTDIQLSMVARLPKDPSQLLLAGDPKQIINPSGFRWEEAKDLFYDRGIAVPPVHHLTLNFRCVGSIVLLANALLKLKQHLLGVQSDERVDDWKFQGRPPFLVRGIPPEVFLQNLSITAADRTILTRTPAERDYLKERLETELVFTIREAKGLEFRTVVLWKFCGDPVVGDMWARIIKAETAALHDHQIRHEINLLYVGITRAQQDLILYDGPEASAVWSSPLLEDLVYRTATLDFLDEAWRATSSPEDWKRQGDYFMEHEHYRAAAECYRNADQPDLMARALGMAHEKQKDYAAAAARWLEAGEERRAAENYDRANQPALAFPIWQRLGEKERAGECRLRWLESEGRYEEAAEIREDRKEYPEAIEDWRKANRHDRAGRLLERVKKSLEAAKEFQAAKDFGNAVRLFLKTKQRESAALCLEQAGRYIEAAQIWERLRKTEEVQRCLHRSGDQDRLGKFFESAADWDKAVDCYRKAMTPELRQRFETEAQITPKRKQDHARRAVRFELLGDWRGAGDAWEKAGESARATAAYKKVREYHAAGRCLVRQGEYLSAMAMFARSPEDRSAGSKALRKCFWRYQRADGKRRDLSPVEDLAKSLRGSKEFEAAACVFQMLGRHSASAGCLALAGESSRALELWASAWDFDSIVRHSTETKKYSGGIAVLRGVLERSGSQSQLAPRAIKALETLLQAWWGAEKSSEARQAISEKIPPYAFWMSFGFVSEILEPLGWYDDILASAWAARTHQRSDRKKDELKREWLAMAHERERAGDWAGAGLWFLCAERADEARRCWIDLLPNRHNHRSLEEVGYGRRVADYLLQQGDKRNAALALINAGEPAAGAELFLQIGDPLVGAYRLELIGQFDEACRLYLVGGNRRKAARMYEKQKKYAEAAALFKELGDLKNYEKCLKRMPGRGVQLSFDAFSDSPER